MRLSRVARGIQACTLRLRKGLTDVYQPVPRAFVNAWLLLRERVQQVHGQGAAARATLYEVERRRCAQQAVYLGCVPAEQFPKGGGGFRASGEVAPWADVGTLAVVAELGVVQGPLHEAGECH